MFRGFYDWRIRQHQFELEKLEGAHANVKNWCNQLGLYVAMDSAAFHASLKSLFNNFEGNQVVPGYYRVRDVLSVRGIDGREIGREKLSFLTGEVVRVGKEVRATIDRPFASVETDCLRDDVHRLLSNLFSQLEVIENIRRARTSRLTIAIENRKEALSIGFRASILAIVLSLAALTLAWLTWRESKKPQLLTVRVEVSTKQRPSLSTVRLIDATLTPDAGSK